MSNPLNEPLPPERRLSARQLLRSIQTIAFLAECSPTIQRTVFRAALSLREVDEAGIEALLDEVARHRSSQAPPGEPSTPDRANTPLPPTANDAELAERQAERLILPSFQEQPRAGWLKRIFGERHESIDSPESAPRNKSSERPSVPPSTAPASTFGRSTALNAPQRNETLASPRDGRASEAAAVRPEPPPSVPGPQHAAPSPRAAAAVTPAPMTTGRWESDRSIARGSQDRNTPPVPQPSPAAAEHVRAGQAPPPSPKKEAADPAGAPESSLPPAQSSSRLDTPLSRSWELLSRFDEDRRDRRKS